MNPATKDAEASEAAVAASLADAEAPAGRLGAALRDLLEAVVLFDAKAVDDESAILGHVADQVRALTSQLSAHRRQTMPWPDESSMHRAHRPFSPVIGHANPIAPPLLVTPDPEGVAIGERAVVGEVTMRPIHEGPPGAIHGGWVASLLDQILGHANAISGVGGMTIELTVRYKRRTPYGVPLHLRARTDFVDGRRVQASGEIVADGVVTAEATGMFLQPTPERIEQMRKLAMEGR